MSNIITEARQWGRDNACGNATDETIIHGLCEMFDRDPDEMSRSMKDKIISAYNAGLRQGGHN